MFICDCYWVVATTNQDSVAIICEHIPSWKGIFKDDSPFVKVGYVSSLEGTLLLQFVSCIVFLRLSHTRGHFSP